MKGSATVTPSTGEDANKPGKNDVYLPPPPVQDNHCRRVDSRRRHGGTHYAGRLWDDTTSACRRYNNRLKLHQVYGNAERQRAVGNRQQRQIEEEVKDEGKLCACCESCKTQAAQRNTQSFR